MFMELARLKARHTKGEPDQAKTRSVRPSQLKSTNSSRIPHGPPTVRLASYSYCSTANAIQTKLSVSKPGDQYEQEADRVAEQVTRMPDTTVMLQRKCGCGVATTSPACEECGSQLPQLQRRAMSQDESQPLIPSIVHDVLRSPGQPLDQSTRAFFEVRFGHDLSQVRIHNDSPAAESAQAVNALAYTLGKNIVFGTGRYMPSSREGRKLIAHELTHVVQQSGLPLVAGQEPAIGGADQRNEREGGKTANGVGSAFGSTNHQRSTGSFPGNVIMRVPIPGCTRSVTGVASPDSVIATARADAARRVGAAVANLRAPSSQTLRQLDRHFHCPSVSEIREITTTLREVQSGLQSLPVICISGPADCAPGTPNNVASDGTQRLCPPFFLMSADSQAAQLIAGAAIGRRIRCLLWEPCYEDFTQSTSTFINNAYSYGYFVLENAGYANMRGPANLPCRPLRTGANVVVPPDARTNPGSIQPLSGFNEILPRSLILPVFQDQGGRRFIYHDGMPGGQVYMPGERERFYLPAGRY